jgi:methyl-accepting chemotaxis protein
MTFRDLSVATKLWTVVSLFIAALAALIGFAAVSSSHSQAAADAALGLAENKARLAASWSGLVEGTVARALASAIGADPAVPAAFKSVNAAAIAKVTEVQQQLQALPQSEAERAQIDTINAQRTAALSLLAHVNALREAGNADAARSEALGPMTTAAEVYTQSLRDYVALVERVTPEIRARVAADRRNTVMISAAAVGAIILGMLLGTLALVRTIRDPLREAVALADTIAAGNLAPPPPVQRADEFGDMMRALGAMARTLSATVGQVRQSADSIQVASAEVAAGNIDLSQRTEQAASSLQQTASSMEQLTATVRQSADAATQANQLATSASAVARRGGAVVAQVVSTMDEINHSSKRIADIISTIDGIAFQTNILALNAAVEAARAGEQGRGFAVVAAEVRSLAQRSAEAAREIKALISASVGKVESGARLVQGAGTTMGEIVDSVQRVSDVIAEISAAAAEQSQGIAEVNGAVSKLDQATQQNAALVEQSAAAAESLKGQALRLTEVVSQFRIVDSAASMPVIPAPPARHAPHRPAHATPHATAHATAKSARIAPPPVKRAASPALAPAAAAPGDWESF